MGLYELRCHNCGGQLDANTLKCPYCGSQYERENQGGQTIYIQTCPAQLVPLRYQMEMPIEDLSRVDPEILAEHCMKEITHSIAEALVPYIKFETERDPFKMRQIIRGSIRVVEPDFRF